METNVTNSVLNSTLKATSVSVLETTSLSSQFKDTSLGVAVLCFCMILIVIIGFVGNSMIVFIFGRKPHLRKKNFLLIVISVLYASGSLFFSLDIYHLYHHKVMVDPVCTIHAYAISTLCVGGIHQLALLSFERYIGINYPFTAMKLPLRTKFLFAALAFSWTLITTTPPLFGWSKYKPIDKSLHYCVFDYLSKEKSTQEYILFLFINGYLLPLIIIGFLNYKIFLTAKNMLNIRKIEVYNRRLRGVNSSTTYTFDNENSQNLQELVKLFKTSGVDEEEVKQSLKIYEGQQRKCARVIFYCVSSFVISWTPYAFTSIIWNIIFDYQLNPNFVLFTAIAAKMFVIWNPIIYGFMDRTFKRECVNFLETKFKYWLE